MSYKLIFNSVHWDSSDISSLQPLQVGWGHWPSVDSVGHPIQAALSQVFPTVLLGPVG